LRIPLAPIFARGFFLHLWVYLQRYYQFQNMATIEDFGKLDIRVGKIISAQPFPEARKPAYKLMIDFGPEIGLRASSAQITTLYTPEELVDKLIHAVINFPPRQIGPFISEVLILGVPDPKGNIILTVPDKDTATIGGRLS
jgi:tRNA-binding protein